MLFIQAKDVTLELGSSSSLSSVGLTILENVKTVKILNCETPGVLNVGCYKDFSQAEIMRGDSTIPRITSYYIYVSDHLRTLHEKGSVVLTGQYVFVIEENTLEGEISGLERQQAVYASSVPEQGEDGWMIVRQEASVMTTVMFLCHTSVAVTYGKLSVTLQYGNGKKLTCQCEDRAFMIGFCLTEGVTLTVSCVDGLTKEEFIGGGVFTSQRLQWEATENQWIPQGSQIIFTESNWPGGLEDFSKIFNGTVVTRDDEKKVEIITDVYLDTTGFFALPVTTSLC